MKNYFSNKLLTFIMSALFVCPMMLSAQPKLVSEYCQKSMGGDADHGAAVGFTWETNSNGDVVITLSEVDGGTAGTALFRANGMCPDNLERFRVGGVAAANFFEREFTAETNIYTLKLKEGADAPALGTVITFNNQLVEYKTSLNQDAWPNLTFSYTYGSQCAALDQPTNVDISSSKVITFDAVASATSYKAYVYWRGDLWYEQEVTNGGTLNFTPRFASTYQVVLQAYGADDSFSPASDDYDWVIATGTSGGYAPASTICDYIIQNGSNVESQVLVSWVTNLENGDIEISIAPKEGGDENFTYWVEDGMRIGGFRFNGENTFANYFDAGQGNNVPAGTTKLVYHPKTTGDYIPQYGDVITFTNDYIVYRYAESPDHVWPNNITFPNFIYGTNCDVENDHVAPIIEITQISSTVNSVTLQIDVTEKNDAGEDSELRSLTIRDETNGYEEEDVVLNGSNQVTLSGLAYNTTYNFTVKAIDLGSNPTEETIEVVLPFNTNLNLAEGKEAVAGKTQGDNVANRGCDGNNSSMWSSFGTQDQSKEWWYVDLGTLYAIRQVRIKWMNDYAKRFLIQGVATLPAEEDIDDDSKWTTFLDYTYLSDPGNELQTHNVAGKMRYLRLKSLQNEQNNGIEFYELEVYASGFATEDNVAPVFGTATCATNTATATATFTLTATDAVDGTISDFYISCADPAVVEAKYAVDGNNQIAISDLDVDHDYNFLVRCRDLSGNWVETNLLAHFAMASGTNVAAGKTATAGREEGANTADKAVDNSASTRWGNYRDSGITADESWWQVDLANAYRVEQISISWEHFPGNGIIIEGSLDGSNYSEIATRSTQSEAETITITGTAASTPYRYVRIKSENETQFMSFYDFAVYASEELVLLSFADNAQDNSTLIAGHDDDLAIVTLNRTIEADGEWYTLCLPFDMSAAKVSELFGNCTIAEYVDAEDKGSLIHLNFDFVNSIEAGKPYLIKVGRTFTAGNKISDVVIKDVSPIVVNDPLMHFQGIYNATTLYGDKIRFLGDDNYLYSPYSGGTPIGAFRCYFTIPTSSPAPGRIARVFVGETVVTDIDLIDNNTPDNATKYLREGKLYIVRDGRTYNAQGILVK